MSGEEGGEGLVPQPLTARHLQAGEEKAVRDERAPHLAGDEGVCVDLEVGEDGKGWERLLTGDTVPADGETGEAGTGGRNGGEVDLTVVAAVAEQPQLPELLPSHLQDWRDEGQADTAHREGVQPGEARQGVEALELPRVDVVYHQLLQLREDQRDQLGDAGPGL